MVDGTSLVENRDEIDDVVFDGEIEGLTGSSFSKNYQN